MSEKLPILLALVKAGNYSKTLQDFGNFILPLQIQQIEKYTIQPQMCIVVYKGNIDSI